MSFFINSNTHIHTNAYISFGDGAIRWINILKDNGIKDVNKSSKDKDLINKIQEQIILSNDYVLAYFCALDFSHNRHKMQKIIIEKATPKYCYMFAKHIPNSDIKALQSAILKTNKYDYICKFACHVQGADLNLLEDQILKSKNSKYAYLYIKNNKKANIEKFKNMILKSNNAKYLFELSRRLSDKTDISRIEKILIKLKDYQYIRLFAEKIKYANISKLEKIILQSDDEKEIKKFAKNVKSSSLKNFLVAG